MGSLRVGIQLPETEREVRWAEYVAMARAAEAAGFDSIWLGDHMLYRGDGRHERGPWDAWTFLAGLAEVTERVRLGPLVACAAFHPPGAIAKMASSVDEISAGRLVLGLGAGWSRPEFEAFGIPFDHLASRFEEAFEIIRRLLAGERVSFSGRYWDLDDAVLLPSPRRRPPLMVGSNGPRLLAATLPHVDVWNTWFDGYGNTPEGFADLSATIDDAARRVGRPPEEVARSACVFVVLDGSTGERQVGDEVPPLEGMADHIARVLREFEEAGADEAILVVNPITERSIRALGEAVALLKA
ncbi:MAG: LLM class flavin-dependent oxidoreductase [Actinomycetota bacterium]|nr:LLM class flavin-dependent oxidoreductase [Actinomycetota bacterium]